MIETQCTHEVRRPVGKIICVGRNYEAHVKEMKAARPKEPLLFLKPTTAIVMGDCSIPLPKWSADIHHEVEMVVRICLEGANLDVSDATQCVDAVAVGLDLTARDVQAKAKAEGAPWAVSKGFDGAAPLGSFVAVNQLKELSNLDLELRVNGELRQCGNTRDMIWSLPELVSFISSRFRLEPGDLIFTGTPDGVGPLRRGDQAISRLGQMEPLTIRCL
jgi:2-keto-4-pentenoate hydratase/2-oxohepta-3-ene-1,7-dioic acid hydratase in catechol pathway